MNANLLCAAILNAFFLLGTSAVAAAGDQTPLDKVELIRQAQKPRFASLPKDAPKPVLYFLENATVPSCGLLASEKSSMITPMLETDPGENFPNCLEVTDGAMFRYRGVDGYVFRYRQRDTREDVSTVYYFVRKTSDGLQPIDKLNMETTLKNKSIKYIAAWAKFRLISLENEKDSQETSIQHSIISDAAIVNVSRNSETGSCRTVADTVFTESGIDPVSATCSAILSSTSLVRGKATYFIVLIGDESLLTKGQIFSVRDNKIHRAADLEKRLSSDIGSGNILEVKEALRKYLVSH
ncbi:MAG TPA: hypothetical protein VK448_08245 [Dissulfurispiraceae bacterium]|nr:hypothetical protein [Dissulfurispiraceae bacterium]